MKRSVFLTSFLGYVLIIFILSALVLLLSFGALRKHYINTRAQDLEHLAVTVRLYIAPLLEHDEHGTLDSLVKELGASINTRITIIDTAGVVRADSKENPVSMENHKRRLEVLQALAGQTGTALRFSRTVNQEMLYVAIPVKHKGTITGVVRVSLFLSEINALLNDLKLKMLSIAVVTIVFSLLVAFVVSRSLSKPIRELVHASRRIAQGDFDVTILSRKKDELKDLADSFNHMVGQLKALVTELTREKEALNTIIASMQEAVLVIDKKGKIVLCNKSLRRIVHSDEVVGRFYWELLRTPRLSTIIDTVIRSEDHVAQDKLEINDQQFICSAAYLHSAKQVVLTLNDVTEIMTMAALKKDIVLNVSHELRTPLTAIKGFVETLDQAQDTEKAHYLEIIKRHTDRLINMVKDLQLLSELEETGTSALQVESVSIQHILMPVLKMFEPELKKKNLSLNLEIEENLPHVQGDMYRLEQLFINLIDNAVKYTEKGGITIRARQSSSAVLIEIQDTGIGIPREHLARIFERFYVVDKSRSRKMGGTGLGLSIVKHIVQVHNGEIHVASEINKGSTFTVSLPKSQ